MARKNAVVAAVAIMVVVSLAAGVYIHFGSMGGDEYISEFAPDTKAWGAVMNLEFTPFSSLPVPWAAAETTLENGENMWDVPCWSGHFVSSHIGGAGRWYFDDELSQGETTPVYMPTQGILAERPFTSFPGQILDKIIDTTAHPKLTIEGQEVYGDMSFNVYLNKYVAVQFAHLGLLASVVEELENSADGYIYLEPGRLLGYANGAAAVDFAVLDSRVNNQMHTPGFQRISETGYSVSELNSVVCPLDYFNENVKQKIMESYNKRHQYEVALGYYPESVIDRPFNVNVENTVWCFWDDLTGRQQGDEHQIMLLNKPKIDHETFTNPTYFGWSPPSDYLGLFRSERFGFTSMFVYHESGNDQTEGVFRLEMFSQPTTYVKYKVDLTGDTFNNTLTFEYFDHAAAAQGAFTQDARVLYRNAGIGTIGLAKP